MSKIDTQALIDFLLQQEKEIKSIELDTGLKIYFDYLSMHNRQGTVKAYKDALKSILNYFESTKIERTNQITNEVIDKYIKFRKPYVKVQTLNKEFLNLKIFMNFLIKKKYIDKMEFTYEKLPETKTIIDTINEEDIKKIINYFKNTKTEVKYKLIFFLILTTGVRTNELLNIKNQNIDLINKRILLDFTKTHVSRYLYLVDDIIPLLEEVKNNNLYLFNDNEGYQLSSNALRCFFKHLKAILNIEVLSPHKLRHFYATKLYDKSLDIYLVSNLLGHTNVKTTEIYLDINNKDIQDKNEKFNPIKYLGL